jgi:hypothetical protein
MNVTAHLYFSYKISARVAVHSYNNRTLEQNIITFAVRKEEYFIYTEMSSVGKVSK